MASQVLEFNPPSITSSPSVDYESQPTSIHTLTIGTMSAYEMSLHEGSTDTPLGTAQNNTETTFNLPILPAGVHALEATATASLHLCGLRHSASQTTPFSITITKSTPRLSITINPNTTVYPSTETRVECTSSTTQATPQLTRNGTPVTNPDIAMLPSGNYEYACTTLETQNYTSTTTTATLAILDFAAPAASGLTWNYANGSMGTAGAITWTTDENANSTLYYGNTSGTYTRSSTNAATATSHNQPLSNLDANTTYYYLIQSCDAGGNCANTSENLFVTPAPFERVQIAGKYVSALKSFGSVLYLGTDDGVGGRGGIYTTVDGSTLNWVTNVSDRRIQTFGVLDGNLYAGTGSTYGQFFRRNTNSTWTNLVNFTNEKQVEAIAEYYYAPDGITYRYLGMWNGTASGTQVNIYYNPDVWGTDAIWGIYATPSANRVTSFAVLGDQIYAGLQSVGWEDTWCNKGYLLGCTPYRSSDSRGTGRANFVKHNETNVVGAYSYLQFVGQNTSNMNNWQDTLTFASAPSSVTAGNAVEKEYLATSTGAGGYDLYQSSDGGATWKKIYSALGAMPKVEEHGGKVYIGTSNAGGTQGYLLRST